MQANKRMFVFDSCFGKMTGHWESYCKRLYNELTGRGHQVTVYGEQNHDAHVVEDVNFVPLFENCAAAEIKSIFDLNQQTQRFLQDFKKIDTSAFADGDVFIFHSIFPQILPAIIEWTKSILVQKKITVTLFFQFPPAESKIHLRSWRRKIYYKLKRLVKGKQTNNEMDWLDNNLVRFYQFNNEELARLVANGSFQLYTSTDVLSRNFSILFGLPVYNLPMPGPYIENKVKAGESETETKIKIGYFGHSSLAKGGQFLQYLVDSVLARTTSVEFILHINPNPETEIYLDYFKHHQLKNVSCHFGHMDQQKLAELVEQVDVILLPYSPDKYHTTPSAIFTDAMPLKKVFVLPLNSWAHKEAIKHGAGITSFQKFNQRSILNALTLAIENFYELKEQSSEAAISFVNEHNIKNYIDIFETQLITGTKI